MRDRLMTLKAVVLHCRVHCTTTAFAAVASVAVAAAVTVALTLMGDLFINLS